MKVSESTARDLNRRFSLSKEVTSKLHAASKAHGVTITNVASAFLALAFTESLLKGAAKAGEERFKAVYGGFTNSTHFLLPMNFVDQVRVSPLSFFRLSILSLFYYDQYISIASFLNFSTAYILSIYLSQSQYPAVADSRDNSIFPICLSKFFSSTLTSFNTRFTCVDTCGPGRQAI